MHIRVFTLRLDVESGEFDDSAVAEFCESHVVSSIAHYVVTADAEPVLVILVTWRAVKEQKRTKRGRGRAPAVSEEDFTSPDEKARYNALCQWRNQYARVQGKPPYVVFKNRQALEIARLFPRSLSELAKVEGIGPSKLEEFGQAIIELLPQVKVSPISDDNERLDDDKQTSPS